MQRTSSRSHQGSSTLTGWGRAHHAGSEVISVSDIEEYASVLGATHRRPVVARGCGSSYGDAATCSGGAVLDMTTRRELLHLDVDTGIAVAEAGLTIGSLLALTAHHGWRPPVLPGTPNVTLGGAVAADIHGKNHPDAGSFGRHVEWLTVLSGDLRPHLISAEHQPDQFWATVGGLGLTGPILIVALRLTPLGVGRATTRRLRAGSLRGVMNLLTTAFEPSVPADDAGRRGDVHAVAWLDGSASGRGLVDVTTLPLPAPSGPASSGPVAAGADRPGDQGQAIGAPTRRVAALTRERAAGSPVNWSLPSLPGPGLVTRATIRGAGVARWSIPARRLRHSRVDAALFPLRHAEAWPALFGSAGLIQYQLAVPTEAADAVAEYLTAAFTATAFTSACLTSGRISACSAAFTDAPADECGIYGYGGWAAGDRHPEPAGHDPFWRRRLVSHGRCLAAATGSPHD